jgi:hypothetical protein
VEFFIAQHVSNVITFPDLHSDTTPLQPNRTNTPVHTETEQYTYIQSPVPEDECDYIGKMLNNKKLHKVTSSWFNLFNQQNDARSNKHNILLGIQTTKLLPSPGPVK